MIKLALILLLASCTRNVHKEVQTVSVESAIKTKANLYISLNPGWAHLGCDSLGFTALCKLSGGCKEADIFQAEDNGMWYRTADHKCYDGDESASDFSKDMMIMLLPYLYHTNDIAAIRRIKSYGDSHLWRFGRGPISRTVMSPPIIAMVYKMTGEIRPLEIETQEVSRGFEDHLDAVWAMTRAMVYGGMAENDYKMLSSYSESQPRNALFLAFKHRYSDGNMSSVNAILMDETLFPNDKLPSTSQRCEGYLWQRDYADKDWKPCKPEVTHDGLDFLFAAWVSGQL